MTKVKKKNLKIIGATSMCLFTLTGLFTSTIAWFAFNAAPAATGMVVQVKIGDTDVNSMTVHRCDLSNSTSSVLKFYETPSVTVSGHGSVQTASGIEMNDYSTLNQTQPVLLLFTFNGGIVESDINVTATAGTDHFVSVATASNIGEFPFSSAVSFKSASYTSQSFPFDNVLTSDLSASQSFVSLTKDEDGNIVSSSFDSEIDVFTGSGNSEITYMAIILDYYPDAIDYIVKNTEYEVFHDHDNCIDFFCDWVLAL